MSIWKALGGAVLTSSPQQKLTISKGNKVDEKDIIELRLNDVEADLYIQQIIQETSQSLYNTDKYETYLVGLFAVGMAVARCDGRIVEEEKREIHNFINCVSQSELPQRYLDKFDAIKNMVFLNFNTAMTFVGQMDKDTWEVVDHLIALTIKADGHIAPQEIEFYQQWRAWLEARV